MEMRTGTLACLMSIGSDFLFVYQVIVYGLCVYCL